MSSLFSFGEDVMRENQFQKEVIDEIKRRLPGAVVLKNDANYLQGVPDLSIFYGDRWAMLEIKRDVNAHTQPNQEYYVSQFDNMSFASIIYPQNKEVVLDALQRSLQSPR